MTARDEGFTVIEVLVAFAILSLALVGLYDALAATYRGASATRLEEEALAVGRSQIERLGYDMPLASGTLEGALSDGSTWKITIREVAIDPAASSGHARYFITFSAVNRDGTRLIQLRTVSISHIAP